MVEVTLNEQAEAEYEQALGWYIARSPQAADRFIAAFDEAMIAIGTRPTLFPLCDRKHRFVSLGRFPYSIIYRFEGEIAEVIAVAHAKRRPGYRVDLT